ncbi:nuclear transport factor 2 family protein [Spongiibacter marinus]|uniref:nuclear transport factor 2 family protein n=1 Tax=Spongiibacter marinus TaxID=354246 RepID=UPI0004180768|nr:nuclear transport factor 2 family protein [Spongiibacter marinus]
MSKAVIEDYFRTYNSASAEALSAFYHPDVVLRTAEGEFAGPQAILGVYQHIIAQFYDQMTPTRIVQRGDEFCVDIQDRFTAKMPVADFLGRSFAKGDSLVLYLHARYRLQEGRIISADIRAAEVPS